MNSAEKSLTVGISASLSKAFTQDEVNLFSQLSLDSNEVHLNPEYAARTKFGKTIVHGALTSSLISAVLGTKLPGPGTIYLEQSISFKAPVYPGETITATVSEAMPKCRYKLKTICTNLKNEIVISGEALVLFR